MFSGEFLGLPRSKAPLSILTWAPYDLHGRWFPPLRSQGRRADASGLTRGSWVNVPPQMCVAPRVTLLTICYWYLIWNYSFVFSKELSRFSFKSCCGNLFSRCNDVCSRRSHCRAYLSVNSTTLKISLKGHVFLIIMENIDSPLPPTYVNC